MAIQGGSGGLRYPLPSQAEINARQSAAAASAGGSAAATAYAANRRYGLGRRELAQKSQQAAMDRGFKAQQSFYDREHQMGGQLADQQARIGLQEDRQTFQEGESKLSRAAAATQGELSRDAVAAQGKLSRKAAEDAAKARRKHDIDRDKIKQDRIDADTDAAILRGIASGKFELPKAADTALKKMEQDRADEIKKIYADDNKMDDRQIAEYDAKAKILKHKLLGQYKETSGSARWNKRKKFWNPVTGKFQDDGGEGLLPYIEGPGGQPVPMPMHKKPDTVTHKGETGTSKDFTAYRQAEIEKIKDWQKRKDAFLPKSESRKEQEEEERQWNIENPKPDLPPTIWEINNPPSETGQPGLPPAGPQGNLGFTGPSTLDSSFPSQSMPSTAEEFLQPPSGQAPPGAPPPDPQAAEEVAVDDPLLQAIMDRAFKIGDETGVGDITKIKDPEMKKEAEFLSRMYDAVSNGKPISGVKVGEAKWLPPGTVFYDDTGKQRVATPGNGGGSLGDVNRSPMDQLGVESEADRLAGRRLEVPRDSGKSRVFDDDEYLRSQLGNKR